MGLRPLMCFAKCLVLHNSFQTQIYAAQCEKTNLDGAAVMSSCLCKYGEGAGFPFQVESLEDGVDDTVHALDIYEAGHGTRCGAALPRSSAQSHS